VRVLYWLVREPIVVSVILINAVAVFAMSYFLDPVHERVWFGIDYGCVVYFLVEAAIAPIL